MNGPICQCFTNVVECITMKPHLTVLPISLQHSICMKKRSEKNIKLENYVKYSRQQ